ncbi:hypothetical protein ABIC83_002845 [Roseateles asaccharophilus]|uniref:hypothetical protein n=1 Tax=Roseateles asaccharophilus TaxID=582607 RepID=UPI00383923E1
MTGKRLSEARLCDALADTLPTDPAFATWFWKRTRFADIDATCVDVRSNSPWSNVTFNVTAGDGQSTQLVRGAETDVLAIYVDAHGRRLALHIENKLANGSFTLYQPETYRARIDQWRGRPNFGMYSEGTSILVAPQAFLQRHSSGAALFDAVVTHEDLAPFIPGFS